MAPFVWVSFSFRSRENRRYILHSPVSFIHLHQPRYRSITRTLRVGITNELLVCVSFSFCSRTYGQYILDSSPATLISVQELTDVGTINGTIPMSPLGLGTFCYRTDGQYILPSPPFMSISVKEPTVAIIPIPLGVQRFIF